MTTETGMPEISFAGSKKVQECANRAFQLLRARGMFMSDDAPIRAAKADLVEYLTGKDSFSEKDVEAALTGNAEVFLIEQNEDGVEIVATTRVGRAPGPAAAESTHTFAKRFLTPEPKVDRPVRKVRERVRVAPEWATYTIPDLGDDAELEDDEDEFEADLGLTPQAAETPVVETPIVAEPAVETVAPVEPEAVEAEISADTLTPEPAVAEAEEVVEETAAVEQPAIEEEPVVVEAPVAETRPEPEPTPEPKPEPKPAPVAQPRGSQPTDVSGYDDDAIAAAVHEVIAHDAHVAQFGGQWLHIDRAHRLSRGELRKIKDYIEEQEQPLADETLVQDILGVRHNSPDYDAAVFGLNVGLSRERDFEFVGTADQKFWATHNLPAIGTNLRKPNDIGTDYRYLVDDDSAEAAPRSVSSVDHVVTFYEYQLGILPLDEELRKLVPASVMDDQRTTVFTFEIPQTYTTYLVELRHPTPTRGGFFLGLDDFYFDSIVPGAMITISATDNDGHYKVEYLQAKERTERILELEEKRSPKYHYRPTAFTCEVDSSWLINEDRFPNLANDKPLAEKVRRRNDSLVQATFERIGVDDGNGGLLASFEDLLAAVNIERPMSEALLRATIEGETAISGDDANGYTYVAA